jgi:DNA-binding transcriptional regulator YdaS (Cro superfamily)
MNKLNEYLSIRGRQIELANRIGVSGNCVFKWKKKLPAERVIEVSLLTGIPKHELRPDLFENDIKIGKKDENHTKNS